MYEQYGMGQYPFPWGGVTPPKLATTDGSNAAEPAGNSRCPIRQWN